MNYILHKQMLLTTSLYMLATNVATMLYVIRV